MSPNAPDVAARAAARPGDARPATGPTAPVGRRGLVGRARPSPTERVERDGVDGLGPRARRPAPVRRPGDGDPRPRPGLISWVHFAPPIGDGFRKSYRTLLRWNDEFPFVKFSLAEDGRPTLSTEIPLRASTVTSSGWRWPGSLAICDTLLPESASWLWIGGRIPDQPGDARATRRSSTATPTRCPSCSGREPVDRRGTAFGCSRASTLALPLLLGPATTAPAAAAGAGLTIVGDGPLRRPAGQASGPGLGRPARDEPRPDTMISRYCLRPA